MAHTMAQLSQSFFSNTISQSKIAFFISISTNISDTRFMYPRAVTKLNIQINICLSYLKKAWGDENFIMKLFFTDFIPISDIYIFHIFSIRLFNENCPQIDFLEYPLCIDILSKKTNKIFTKKLPLRF